MQLHQFGIKSKHGKIRKLKLWVKTFTCCQSYIFHVLIRNLFLCNLLLCNRYQIDIFVYYFENEIIKVSIGTATNTSYDTPCRSFTGGIIMFFSLVKLKKSKTSFLQPEEKMPNVSLLIDILMGYYATFCLYI